MSEQRSVGASAALAGPESGAGDRIIIVEPAAGGWRVKAAHMEPLRFITVEEAEHAARRAARNLARLGLNARVETHRRSDDRPRQERFPAEVVRLRFGRRRRLDA